MFYCYDVEKLEKKKENLNKYLHKNLGVLQQICDFSSKNFCRYFGLYFFHFIFDEELYGYLWRVNKGHGYID